MKIGKILSGFLGCILMISCGTVLPAAAADSTVEMKITVGCDQSRDREMLALINEFRTGNDTWYWDKTNTEKVWVSVLKPLVYDYELEQIAMTRACELVAWYDHERPDGSKWSTAYTETFYNHSTGSPRTGVAENLDTVYTSSDDCERSFIRWREDNEDYDDQGHRRNMLSEKYTAVGVAHVEYGGRSFYVQEFAAKTGNTTPTPKITSKTATLNVSSSKIKTSSVTPTKAEMTMTVGDTATLPGYKATYRTTKNYNSYFPDINVTGTAAWGSGNSSSIASGSGTKVTALSPGSGTFTLNAGGAQMTLALTVKAKTVTYPRGDVNGDGKTDLNDLSLFIAHIKGTRRITDPAYLSRADVNGDGKYDETDLGLMVAHHKGKRLLF